MENDLWTSGKHHLNLKSMSIRYRQQIVYIYMPGIIITLNRCHSIFFTFKLLFEYISIFILKVLRMGIITLAPAPIRSIAL